MSKRPWSDAEDHLIESKYDSHGIGYLVEKLPHRSKLAIRQRVYVLSANKKNDGPHVEIVPSDPIALKRYEIRQIEEQVHKLEAQRAKLVRECNEARTQTMKHTGCSRRVA